MRCCSRHLSALAALAVLGLAAAPGPARAPATPAASAHADPIVFELLPTETVGFVTQPSRTDRKHQPETMVSGVALLDYDNDGLLDIYVVNGATMPGLQKTDESYHNRLFHSKGNWTFEDVTARAGVAGQGYELGVAVGDYDNDGYVDVVATDLHGPLALWRNVSPKGNHWLIVATQGTKSNRDGMGAELKLVSASGTQYNHVNTAMGYGCASDRRVHFGLGKDQVVQSLTITWPGGVVQTLNDIPSDHILTVREP